MSTPTAAINCLNMETTNRGWNIDFVAQRVQAAQRELAVCDGCKGVCVKEYSRYWQPMIQGDTVAMARCEFGIRRELTKASKAAQIPVRYADKTFDDYEVTGDNETALKIAKWYAAQKPEKSVYLFGKCGTGKTFLASLTARQFISDRRTVIFGDVPTLLDDLKREFNGGDAASVLDRYLKCDLLVLDDLGAGQFSEWSVGIIYRIINERYNAGKRLILTSNFDLDGLQTRLKVKDEYSAQRIISRLNEMCVQAFLGTKDRRKAK